MAVTRRTRSLSPTNTGRTREVFEGRRRDNGKWESIGGTPVMGSAPTFHGSQITDSEEHQWPPSGGQHDVGGPFFTIKKSVRKNFSRHSWIKEQDTNPAFEPVYGRYRFNCDVPWSCPIETVVVGSELQPKWPTALNSSNSSLTALGATAASRCRPTAGEVDLSTALGELFRDGIPRLIGAKTWRERTLRARNAGDEYLNVEFGWDPLISDVKSFGETVINSHSILSQYERDRGRVIRRSYSFPVEESSTDIVLSTNKSPDGPLLFDTPKIPGSLIGGKWSRTTSTFKRRWFSGAFVYGSPARVEHVQTSAGLAEEADRLFGVSLTPDVLWNLTPWSWAIDWFSNTGDVLSYMGDVISQGLVMQYGYFMEHTFQKVEYSLVGCSYKNEAIRVPNAVLVTETKSRTKANPFGFGVTWNGLSAAQAAILAALGISRT